MGYQLYVSASLAVIQLVDLRQVGSLKGEVAMALYAGKTDQLGDDDTGYIMVDLQQVQVSKVAEARKFIESKKREIFGLEDEKEAQVGGNNGLSHPLVGLTGRRLAAEFKTSIYHLPTSTYTFIYRNHSFFELFLLIFNINKSKSRIQRRESYNIKSQNNEKNKKTFI